MGGKLVGIMDLPLDQIHVENRFRPVSDAAVKALIEAIKDTGLRDEVHVRKLQHRGGKLVLMAGAHRIEAYRQMGHETIPSKVWTCTDDWATLVEVDDQLAHSELSPLDLSVFLAKRKAAYERMHPETKKAVGAALVAKRWNTSDTMSLVSDRQNNIVSFCASVAEVRQMSKRHIERLVAVGEALDPTAIELLRAAPKPTTFADLQVIAKAQPDDRPIICRELSLGKAKSANEVMARRKNANRDRASASDKELTKLDTAYSRAGKAIRRSFVAMHEDSLRALLAELDGGDAEVLEFKSRGRS